MTVVPLAKRRKIETVGDQVLEHLRHAVLSGHLPAGSRIDQHAIAAELGVSLIPVRESLRQLEAEGLIEKRAYRGAFVAELSITELMDIYTTRETLEELATVLAVRRMNDETLESLKSLIAEMESATTAEDRSSLFDLNASFHFTLYNASHNNILCQIIESLWDRSTIYRRRFTFMPERVHNALAEHKEILAACFRRDAEGAGQAVRHNVAQTTRAIAENAVQTRSPSFDD